MLPVSLRTMSGSRSSVKRASARRVLHSADGIKWPTGCWHALNDASAQIRTADRRTAYDRFRQATQATHAQQPGSQPRPVPDRHPARSDADMTIRNPPPGPRRRSWASSASMTPGLGMRSLRRHSFWASVEAVQTASAIVEVDKQPVTRS
jgi:hypothetical protein